MTPEELSALADRIAGISSGKARFYFLVFKGCAERLCGAG